VTLKTSLSPLIKSEDWWACWLAISLFAVSFFGIINIVPKPTIWFTNPFDALSLQALISYLSLLAILLILFSICIRLMAGKLSSFVPAFVLISILGLVAQVASKQVFMDTYGLGYVLWALIIGLVISNTMGLPTFLKPAMRTELYLKTGLVLLGAEILIPRILNLGIKGLILAWGVTPIVLFLMYRYGTIILKLDKTLTILMAAATSVCGVSAAIAVAAATKAKNELLTLTISISMLSTVILLVGLPAIIKITGIDYLVGGAWIGGTLDSTGAVVAAGELLNEQAMEVATVIKLIQNVLIGVVAFIVALLWVTNVDKRSKDKPSIVEVWYRFPKFIIAFILLSLISSFIIIPRIGEAMSTNILILTGGMRTFLFAIAFLSIGLKSDFKSLKKQVSDGKSIHLYIAGQSLNLVLTFIFAWLLFSS
jgi:uncharacterized integral membrane protein (TIGR00698 family)